MRKTNMTIYKPKKCWVGDEEKVCYVSEEEATGVARMQEIKYNLPKHSLTIYKCEYGDHWHLANKKRVIRS